MTHYRIALLLFTIFGLSSASFAQHLRFSEAERTIIRLQDERRGIDTIARYLDSDNEKIAWRAAIALANIKDTNSRKTLLTHLKKESNSVIRDAIAFSLGILGPDAQAYTALAAEAGKHPSAEIYIALGRTVPKDLLSSFAGIAGNAKTAPLYAVTAIMEVSIRKLLNEDLAKIIDGLAKNENPEILWRAVYSFSRTDDSSLLCTHITSIKEYLNEIGSPESRMFAATALGRIHNQEAGDLLIIAGRSETEWRVRVNIFNALGKLPRFSSAIDAILKKAVLESSKDSLTLNHVARTALDVLDQMIAAGKVSSPDSVSIREWLADFLPNHEQHEDQSLLIRSQCMIPLARLGVDYETMKDIATFVSYRDRNAEINTWKALGVIADTAAFYHLLEKVLSSPPTTVYYILDGLHSLWEIAKKDTALFHQLEYLHYANIYRHMLVRFADATEDPGIVASTMEELKDPLIVTDSLRKESEEYFLQYLDKYAYPKYHDQLLSIFSAIKWLKPKNDTIMTKLLQLRHTAASEWGDQPLYDSICETILGIRPGYQFTSGEAVKLIREPIDWQLLEKISDTMIISTQYGFMGLKLMIYDAPLTALNMYKLAKINFFANNYFHRVVPNFVIQLGDNTGTGEGGPGYSIRTEISPARYDSTGVVGMASSGRDTEGSQWFITHCPTPHLNTRYTIWGEIINGNEKIEMYQLNDQIINLRPYR